MADSTGRWRVSRAAVLITGLIAVSHGRFTWSALQGVPFNFVMSELGYQGSGFREIARMVPALLLGSAIGNVNELVDRAVGRHRSRSLSARWW